MNITKCVTTRPSKDDKFKKFYACKNAKRIIILFFLSHIERSFQNCFWRKYIKFV